MTGYAEEVQTPKGGLREVVRDLWPSLRPFLPQFGIGVGLIFLSTGVEVLIPWVIGRTVDAAIATQATLRYLREWCGLYLGLLILKGAIETAQAYVIQATGQDVTHNLRAALFEKIQRLPVAYFDKHPTGRLLTRVVNDIKQLSELFTASLSVLALDCLVIVGTVGAMVWMHARLALIVLITFPAVILSIRLYGVQLAKVYRAVRRLLGEINAFLGENIGAIATIQRLAAEESRMRRFRRIVEDHNASQLELVGVYAQVQPVANVINGIAMGTLIIAGGYWVIHGRMSLGILVAFFQYLRNLFEPVRDLVEKYNVFLSSMVSAERVSAILAEPTEWEEAPTLAAASLGPAPAGIRFDRVGFRYPSRSQPALEGISFEIKGGTSLAIVGATGSGKSTLIRLLLRFYDPDTGTISVGGHSLAAWDKKDLRHHIGVVHQEIYLFEGTIRENLTLGREGYRDEYLQQMCERAQLWPFIKHRGGLDMSLLEGGQGFSVGERQLLSFARILVADPPILVLDEATSSIDRRLERRLMAAIKETLLGRTSIVIAHRLSTIKQCHRVLVLEKGRIAEEGTHESLLAAKGVFAKFHEIYSGA